MEQEVRIFLGAQNWLWASFQKKKMTAQSISISWNDQKSIKVKFWVPLCQQTPVCVRMNELKTDSFISNSLAMFFLFNSKQYIIIV